MSVVSNPPIAGVRPAGNPPSLARILRVLLVGAAPQTKWLLESGLSASRHTTRAVLRDAASLAECTEAAASGEYDAVLVDLGTEHGAALVKVTELSATLPHAVPILVLGEDNEALAAEASIRGAQDYIVKDREGVKVLSRALHYAIERRRAEAHIHQLTTFDKLTGLPNRDWLQIQLRQALDSADEGGNRFAVMLLDLDRFKLVNDTLGHGRGDKLLREVSARVRAAVGDLGSVARLGGDEFAVLTAPLDDAAEAGAIADAILKGLSQPFTLEGHDVFVTASIGISIFPNDGADGDALLTNADAAMYKAKEQGRNQAQFHILGTYGAAIRRLTLETELRHAFERDQLTLAYQPQFDSKTGRMIGAEALLRWNHPESGPISPAEFIPIAEETGLILPLGEWVMMKACAEAKSWRNAGWRDAMVAVNVSPRQLTGTHLTESVKKALSAAELPPDALEIEVTEGSLMLNGNEALSLLLEIASLGVRIAVDDFGAGYSSLARLKKFPIGTLKIDRSFIMNLTSDDGDAAIVRAIIAMAKSLEVKTVAEGVETESQLALLKSEGCDLIQGFLLSRPISGDDMHTRIASGRMTERG
ncbi:MAG TPA: EAL domain-containing protein [Alphaproteobacteria bacterium]|nr:EAL domain-containing protein [Alphaproteobacteria bacterium]